MSYLLPAFVGTPEINKVYNVDALTLLRSMPDASVDIVVTSPPYNLRNSSGNGLKAKNDKRFWSNQPMRYGYNGFDDSMPHEEYVAWQRSILVHCMRIIKPAGAIFYNHKWRVQAGLLQDRADIMEGFPVRQIVIWDRGGGFNFNDGYLLPTYEVIYLIAKPDFKLVKGGNAYGDIWKINPSKNKEHPNAFPVEIPRRCVEISGAKLVVDPFGGIGTTARAAISENVNFIIGDTSTQYCEIARKQIAYGFTPTFIPILDAATVGEL